MAAAWWMNRESQARVELAVLGGGSHMLLKGDPRRVGVDGGPAAVTPEVIELGQDDPPVPIA